MRFQLEKQLLNELNELTFNSLYEILIFNENREIGRRTELSILSMRFSGVLVIGSSGLSWMLSILSMRFEELKEVDRSGSNFQFSLWDSSTSLLNSSSCKLYFQFSLWDSESQSGIFRGSVWRTFNSLYEIPDIDKRLIHRLKKSLSILSMRFGTARELLVESALTLFFQFSLWDSTPRWRA